MACDRGAFTLEKTFDRPGKARVSEAMGRPRDLRFETPRQLVRSLRAGTSYLGGNAPELHFGLGEASKVDTCSVTWPSGKSSTHAIDGVDRFVTLAEPR